MGAMPVRAADVGRRTEDRMKSRDVSYWIYLAGVAALGAFLGAFGTQVRHAYGDWKAFAAVVAYLLALRMLGRYFERSAGDDEGR
jgi:hypothetical protein